MNKTCLLLAVFFVCLSFAASAAEEAKPPLLGDESDGSRAVPVHWIPLLDEAGVEISPDDDPLLPFSPRQTCANKCHSYDAIQTGWHFNAAVNAAAGRPGHPWIFVDAATGTQIPLSLRTWPGAIDPAQAGLTPWKFALNFGRQLPGGGYVETASSSDPAETMRLFVSGQLEINCLACHDADPAHDQAEYAVQIARQNLRWAAASTSAFAFVSGSAKNMPDTYDYQMPEPPSDPQLIPPSIAYKNGTFDDKKRVFFNIVRKIPNERCYFCHSTSAVNEANLGEWAEDEDVHVAAGLACVDCHRNGLDHNMIRGYDGEAQFSNNPLAPAATCEGCHLGVEGLDAPVAGRFAAPQPRHAGIPLIHFEKLACTACHSGPWPQHQTGRVKTSLAHGLGTHDVDKANDAAPLIASPVFARQANGKIAPHNLVWPAYWATIKENEGTPIPITIVNQAAAKVREASSFASITPDFIRNILQQLASDSKLPGRPAYISGGVLRQLDEKGQIAASAQEAAKPYLWPIAHNVRPAAQSLGARGCADCHASDSPFFFGNVAVDSPLSSDRETAKRMIEFQGLCPEYIKVLAFTFHFRFFYKLTLLLSALVIAMIVLTIIVNSMNRWMNIRNDE
ncbi:MAG: hypothetical protein AB1656_17665 [Candidatus Omnitrophota bacterium]